MRRKMQFDFWTVPNLDDVCCRVATPRTKEHFTIRPKGKQSHFSCRLLAGFQRIVFGRNNKISPGDHIRVNTDGFLEAFVLPHGSCFFTCHVQLTNGHVTRLDVIRSQRLKYLMTIRTLWKTPDNTQHKHREQAVFLGSDQNKLIV